MANLEVFKTKKKNIAELTFSKNNLICFVGANGIKKKTREGDKVTPRGTFRFLEIYYRPDKVKNIKSNIPTKRIYKNSFWCVDSKSKFYNCYQNDKKRFLCEELYRNDDLYDILITINYNIKPTKKFKGSAIFIHCSEAEKKSTEGCLALEKRHLVKLVRLIKPQSKLIIY